MSPESTSRLNDAGHPIPASPSAEIVSESTGQDSGHEDFYSAGSITPRQSLSSGAGTETPQCVQLQTTRRGFPATYTSGKRSKLGTFPRLSPAPPPFSISSGMIHSPFVQYQGSPIPDGTFQSPYGEPFPPAAAMRYYPEFRPVWRGRPQDLQPIWPVPTPGHAVPIQRISLDATVPVLSGNVKEMRPYYPPYTSTTSTSGIPPSQEGRPREDQVSYPFELGNAGTKTTMNANTRNAKGKRRRSSPSDSDEDMYSPTRRATDRRRRRYQYSPSTTEPERSMSSFSAVMSMSAASPPASSTYVSDQQGGLAMGSEASVPIAGVTTLEVGAATDEPGSQSSATEALPEVMQGLELLGATVSLTTIEAGPSQAMVVDVPDVLASVPAHDQTVTGTRNLQAPRESIAHPDEGQHTDGAVGDSPAGTRSADDDRDGAATTTTVAEAMPSRSISINSVTSNSIRVLSPELTMDSTAFEEEPRCALTHSDQRPTSHSDADAADTTSRTPPPSSRVHEITIRVADASDPAQPPPSVLIRISAAAQGHVITLELS
ncbi:hypothetical protein BC628DRAFT_1414186 [Trametes gibbosa]|nr:hypothetical protein BC628DRAFT_1414186 [Trametes gibbosa]